MNQFISIPEFEDCMINNKGVVYNTKTKKFRKTVPLKSAYISIMFRKNGKYHLFYIHRLVAQAFVPNPENKPCVNHIDGNKQNNEYSNLEWCTHSENNLHRFNVLLKRKTNTKGKTGELSKLSQSVCQISLDGFLLAVFPGVREAARQTNIPKSTILKCRKGLTNKAGNYIWK